LDKRLLLKGGTALNFCYFNRSRLSVDIDLNYIGSIKVELMRKERPKIYEAITKIAEDKGYKILREPGEEHAGGKWRLAYKDLWGNNKNLEFDINYLYRVPIGSPQRINFETFSNIKRFEIFVVSKEELFAGKCVAALERVAPRDIYDVANIVDYTGNYDKNLFRKTVILLGASQREDFRKIKADKLYEVSDKDIKDSLYSLLPRDKRINREELFVKIIPFVLDILNFTSSENEFLDRYLDNAEYKPELLFYEYPDLIPQIEEHPALLWKRLNVEKYLKR
jgi:predicted nucleotidyltransferase component of viral defense system